MKILRNIFLSVHLENKEQAKASKKQLPRNHLGEHYSEHKEGIEEFNVNDKDF